MSLLLSSDGPLLLSAEDYLRQFDVIRPLLISLAYQKVGYPLCEDIVHDTESHGYEDRGGFVVQTGAEGFAKWIKHILNFVIQRHFRQQNRHRRHEVSFTELSEEIVGPQYSAAHIARLGREARLRKLDEIALRVRHADLKPKQKAAMLAMLQGWNIGQTADALGLTYHQVWYNLREAIRKVAQVDLTRELLAAADLDRRMYYASSWEGGNYVTIYYKPPSTGSALAREDVKNCSRRGGCCSVTRKERIL